MTSLDRYQSPLIIYDGDCMLCSRAIRFILRHEATSKLKFLTITRAKELEPTLFVSDGRLLDSIAYYNQEKVVYESQAAFEIARHLRFPFRVVYIFSIVPAPLTDLVYRIIAKSRYRWFGKVDDSCELQSLQDEGRFL